MLAACGRFLELGESLALEGVDLGFEESGGLAKSRIMANLNGR